MNEQLTIIPRARVGYEMIDSQRGAYRRVGYNHFISNKHEWNNCFIKNNQEIMLHFADFALQEQLEDNLCADQLETSTSPPPPGKPRAFELLKIGSFKFPPPRSKMVFKCPTLSSDLSVKCPT